MILKLFYFPLELNCSQIWLSPLVDGSRLTYLTIWKQNTDPSSISTNAKYVTLHWNSWMRFLTQIQLID